MKARLARESNETKSEAHLSCLAQVPLMALLAGRIPPRPRFQPVLGEDPECRREEARILLAAEAGDRDRGWNPTAH